MKVTPFTKLAVGIGCAALVASASILPAHADPAANTYGTLVGLGSDTTQSVLNGLATAIGGNKIASYDATGASLRVITRDGDVNGIPRANGSGAGRSLLLSAIGQIPTANISVYNNGVSGTTLAAATEDVAGKIDFARSSSGPSAQVDGGVLTYIPFAKDAVSYAVASNSYLPKNLSTSDLTAIYAGNLKYVSPTGALAATQVDGTYVKITTLLPQSGSGTRSFWIGKVGLTETLVTANTNGNLGANVAKNFDGGSVQENDGSVFTTGTVDQQRGAIVPFAISQWVAQANNTQADVRHGAVLGSIDGLAPTTGSGTSYVLSSGFSSNFSRLVYNIVASAKAEDESSAIHEAFVGTGSLVCSQVGTIQSYGFATLTDSTGPNACGDTSRTDVLPSTSSIALTVPSGAVKVGSGASLKATITSNGNQGGTVTFYNGSIAAANKLIAAKVAAGSTTAVASYTPTKTGSISVVADFVPALDGISYSQSSASALTVAAQTSKVTIGKISDTTYGKSASAKVTVAGSAGTPTGKVTLKDGSKTLGTATLNKGAATFALPKTLAAGKHTLTASYAGSSTTAASTSGAVSFTVAKAKTTTKVAKVKAVKAGKKPKVTIKVTSATGVPVNGKAVIKEKSKTLKTVTIKNGKATVSLSKKTKAGKHTIKVSFVATSNLKASTAKATVTVKKK